jgi:hypothetical protein
MQRAGRKEIGSSSAWNGSYTKEKRNVRIAMTVCLKFALRNSSLYVSANGAGAARKDPR